MKITAIVLAAGQGKRMNSAIAKQYLLLEGKPILYYSLKAFEANVNINEILLVVGKDEEEYCRENIVNKYNLKKITQIVEGGKERSDSVYNAIKEIKHTDYLLIHDGARPFISEEIINRTVESVKIYKACIIGVPVKDTIKIADDAEFVSATPTREKLWSIQTPQAFKFSIIKEAYELFTAKNEKATDDSMVVELTLSYPIKIIEGSYSNIKITTKEDLKISKKLIDRQEKIC